MRARYWTSFSFNFCVEFIRDLFRKESLGQYGERLAAQHLKRKRYKILHRGFEDARGEIDIVATDGETIVFCEVKTRSSDWAGLPVEAVDKKKQSTIQSTSQTYLRHFRLFDYPMRYDIISVMLDDEGRPVIEHFEAAFERAEIRHR